MPKLVQMIGHPRLAYLYCLVDPRNANVRYIGMAVDPGARMISHCCIHHSRLTRKDRWILELRQLEMKPVMLIICKGTISYIKEMEARFVFTLRDTVLNTVLRRGDPSTLVHPKNSEELQRRMAKIREERVTRVGIPQWIRKQSSL